jgi:hypothetical protein
MSGSSRDRDAGMRQCVYCGKHIRRDLRQGPHCREAQSEVAGWRQHLRGSSAAANFAVGYCSCSCPPSFSTSPAAIAPWPFPLKFSSPVTSFFVPLLFVSGLALTLYGVFLRVRA